MRISNAEVTADSVLRLLLPSNLGLHSLELRSLWDLYVHTLREIVLSPSAGPDNELSCSASAAMSHLNIAALYQSPLLRSLAGCQMKVTFSVLEYQYFVTWLVAPIQTL